MAAAPCCVCVPICWIPEEYSESHRPKQEQPSGNGNFKGEVVALLSEKPVFGFSVISDDVSWAVSEILYSFTTHYLRRYMERIIE